MLSPGLNIAFFVYLILTETPFTTLKKKPKGTKMLAIAEI